MKVSICVWAGEGHELLEEAGFMDRQEIPEESMYDVVRTLFEHRLNVMMWRSKEHERIILFVDTMRFSQR